MNLYVEDTISKYLMIDVDYVVESDDVGVGDLVVINSNVNVDVLLIQLKVQGCCASGNALECLVVHTIAAPLFS